MLFENAFEKVFDEILNCNGNEANWTLSLRGSDLFIEEKKFSLPWVIDLFLCFSEAVRKDLLGFEKTFYSNLDGESLFAEIDEAIKRVLSEIIHEGCQECAQRLANTCGEETLEKEAASKGYILDTRDSSESDLHLLEKAVEECRSDILNRWEEALDPAISWRSQLTGRTPGYALNQLLNELVDLIRVGVAAEQKILCSPIPQENPEIVFKLLCQGEKALVHVLRNSLLVPEPRWNRIRALLNDYFNSLIRSHVRSECRKCRRCLESISAGENV